MRVTHAQPLMPASDGYMLEPRPLLSPALAEVEAGLLKWENAEAFGYDPLEGVPAECFTPETRAMMASGELEGYTHLGYPWGGDFSSSAVRPTCTDYLVRIEP